MTDFELNKAIAMRVLEHGEHGLFSEGHKDSADMFLPTLDGSNHVHAGNFDFNNWSDLMPLVVEYDIWYRYCYLAKAYNAVNNDYAYCANVFNKDLQRALAECLLKVLEAK